MPTARLAHSASMVDGKIYVIGGVLDPNSWAPCFSTVEVYDTGFVPKVITSVEAEGKLATTWGKIRW
jgi:hypothetical protein